MKRLTIFMVFVFFSFSFVSALSISQKDKDNINNAVDIIDQAFSKKGFDYKLEKMQLLYEKIKVANQFLADSQNKNKLLYLQQQLEGKISELEKIGKDESIISDSLELKLQTYGGLEDSFDYLDSNIDWDKFRNAWLSRQNAERKSLGLPPFIISDKLNKSSAIRAEFLSKNNKNSGLHKRKSTDGYYNFDSVYNRFKGLGIDFEWISGAPFTENIGYGYIKCTSNCTDKLISATKKSFDFFMGEKSYNGAHYRAISHKLFREVGVSTVVRNGKYYVVIHYGTEVLD